MTDYLATIICPPFAHYKQQPSDMSKCELVDCPTCNEKMWLSEKKKEILHYHEMLSHEILCECYICFTRRVKDDPKIMQECKMSRI